MERTLAKICKVDNLTPIEGADRIELATIKGWQCIVKKGEFKVGDLGVYWEIDSVLDSQNPMVSFLAERKFRVRTMKMKGQISQGLLMPLSYLDFYAQTVTDGQFGGSLRVVETWNEGDDVTEYSRTTKYEPVIPAQMQGLTKGNFPTHMVSMTDEERVQSLPEVIDEFRALTCDSYWSIKMDGTSLTTFQFEGIRHVCSRKLELKLEGNEGNLYVKMATPLDIPEGFCVQAEICGMGIQKNRMGFNDVKVMAFNVWTLTDRCYLNYSEFIKFCAEHGIMTVPIIKVGKFEYNNVQEMLDFADTLTYPNGDVAEGFVVRPVIETMSRRMRGRLSIKAISNKFLLKHGD